MAASHVSAQTWVTTTDDYLADQVERVFQTRDGRYLAVARTGRALALIKRNTDGSLLWQRLLMGSPTGEAGYDAVELADGRIVAVGDIFVNAHGNDDMGFVIVSADAATVLRQRTFGGPVGDDRALGAVAASDGGFLLVGETLSWGGPGRRMLAVRLDAAGELAWAGAFGSTGGDESLFSGVELATGEFLVAGGAGLVLRLGQTGGLVWSRSYGLDEARELVAAPDGHLVMAGWRTVGSHDVAELVRIDAAGEILWRASYGQAGVTCRFFTVAPLADGGYLAAGEINGPGFADFYGWLVRLDAAGDIMWQRHLNDAGGEVHSVAAATEGGFVAGGHRDSFPRMMLARLDASGQAGGCDHPVTLAARIASTGGWIAEPVTAISTATLVSRDETKPLNEAASASDQVVCLGGPVYPPSEVSPPAASGAPLRFEDESTLTWEGAAPSASARFDLYRGRLSDPGSMVGPDCLAGGLAANGFTEQEEPPGGAAFCYLVGGRNQAGRGPLGHASDGSARQAGTLCP